MYFDCNFKIFFLKTFLQYIVVLSFSHQNSPRTSPIQLYVLFLPSLFLKKKIKTLEIKTNKTKQNPQKQNAKTEHNTRKKFHKDLLWVGQLLLGLVPNWRAVDLPNETPLIINWLAY